MAGRQPAQGQHSGRKSKFVALTGLTMLFCAFIVMAAIFMAAYMSPTKTAVVHVNLVNEAPVELILIITTSVLGLYAFTTLFKDFRNIGRDRPVAR